MVNQSPIDTTFAALADPTRRAMVEQLLQGEATVSQLAEPHDMSMPAVMKHIGKLVDAGLVERRKEGRTVTCSLRIDPMDEAQRWLQRHLEAWNGRLDALDQYLAQQKDRSR
ncbi:MAG: metalloregulator ArsR/SmtB family transcription factor [Pseudomonadota bacterium]